MGVVFDRGRPEQHEEDGPIFAVQRTREGTRLSFGRPGPDLENVAPGDFVWVSSDPRVTRAGEKAAEAGREPLGRIGIDLVVRGELGAPLEVIARIGRDAPRDDARAATTSALAAARGVGITSEMLADKLGGFGGTPFHLRALDATGLPPGLHVPVSELKELRRQLAAALDAALGPTCA
jgi:putative protease